MFDVGEGADLKEAIKFGNILTHICLGLNTFLEDLKLRGHLSVINYMYCKYVLTFSWLLCQIYLALQAIWRICWRYCALGAKSFNIWSIIITTDCNLSERGSLLKRFVWLPPLGFKDDQSSLHLDKRSMKKSFLMERLLKLLPNQFKLRIITWT